MWVVELQNKTILQKTLPDTLKLSIAQKIENNLFSKVGQTRTKNYAS